MHRIPLLIILLASSCASLPTAGGARHEASIDELAPVTVGGVRQWLLLRGEDSRRPVLFFVHGGPGSTLMPFSRAFDGDLVHRFLVVHWDQRQAGKSFDPEIPDSSIRIPRYVEDCLEVLSYLHRRFPTQAIILVGHSWGTVIGSLAAARNPPGLAAYVGVSQVVDFVRSEQLAYAWALSQAQGTASDSATAVTKLGPPPYQSVDGVLGLSAALMQLGGVVRRVPLERLGEAVSSSPDYTPQDLDQQEKAAMLSIRLLLPELNSFRAEKEVPALPVPAWFIQGADDRICPRKLLADFLGKLQAPRGKHEVTLEGLGHFPFWDDPQGFAREIERIAHSIEADSRRE